MPEGGVIQEIGAEAPKQIPATTLEQRITGGKRIYESSCFACHQTNGQGLPGAFPPLAKSDFLNRSKEKSISAVIHGLEGPVKVNDKEFNSVMPAQILSDEDAANVLTYVYSMWGNSKK